MIGISNGSCFTVPEKTLNQEVCFYRFQTKKKLMFHHKSMDRLLVVQIQLTLITHVWNIAERDMEKMPPLSHQRLVT